MRKTVAVQPDDTAFLLEVYIGTRSAEVAAWGWAPAHQEAFLRMQFDLQQRAYAMQYPSADHRVIWHEGVPAGQILVARLPGEIRLVDIAVLPRFRGCGLGSALIRELQAEALQTGKPLRLTVRKGNVGARRLYERLGIDVTTESDLDEAMEWRPPVTSPGPVE